MRILPARFVRQLDVSETGTGREEPKVMNTDLNHQGEHPMLKTQAIGFDATTVIKRSDFGLGAYAPAVSDEVNVRITTEAAVAK